MQRRKSEVIEGFNAFIEQQKAIEGEAYISLTYFNHASQQVVFRTPLYRFNKLDATNYVCEGSTALLDAIGDVVDTAPYGDRMIVVIQTDGEENSSRRWTNNTLKALIEKKQGEGWTFIFLGANVDSFDQARSLGMNLNTVANYDDKLPGQTRAAYMNASMSVGMLRGGASGQCVTDTLRNGLDGNDKAPD